MISTGAMAPRHDNVTSESPQSWIGSAPSDAEVVTALYREMAPLLFNWLRRSLKGDAGLAEELLQETFLRLWAHRATIRASTDGQRRAWLFRVAWRLIINHVRRQKALGGAPLQGGACADVELMAIAAPPYIRATWLAPARLDAQPEPLALTRETLREAVAAAGPVGLQLVLVANDGQELRRIACANGIRPGGAKMYLSRRRGDARRDRDLRRAAEGLLPSTPQRQRLAALTAGRPKRQRRCQPVQPVQPD